METMPRVESVKYKRIRGGLAMPSEKNPGFAVILGEVKELGFRNKPKYVFLNEIEDWDGRSLVRRAAGFDYFYKPMEWFGDSRDVALDTFTRELNKETSNIDELKKKVNKKEFRVTYSGLLFGQEQDKPYTFIAPRLNELLGGADRNKARQRLSLKEGSKLMAYMKMPQSDKGDAVSMQFGDYPAIDALAFCVFGMIEAEERRDRPPQQEVADGMDFCVL